MADSLDTRSSTGTSVHKFGGSSLADGKSYQRVCGIIEQYGDPRGYVVVSAAGKTTNQLLQLLQWAKEGEQAAAPALLSLYEMQHQLITELLEQPDDLLGKLEQDIQHIGHLLQDQLTEYVENAVLSYGEVWSARLLANLMTQRGTPAKCLDAREVLCAELAPLPVVDMVKSRHQFEAFKPDGLTIMTGFIACDSEGRTVTLGRNGSDYSATLLASLCGATDVTIWSDVAGIYSADPRMVKDASLLRSLSQLEASELSRLGAPVLHKRTLAPIYDTNCALYLRSSFEADAPGTALKRHTPRTVMGREGGKIVSSCDDIHLLELKLPRSIELDQAANSVMAALAEQHLSPLCLQRQRDSHSVVLAYTGEVVESASHALGLLPVFADGEGEIEHSKGYQLVSIVGAGITEHSAQCHQFYQLMAEHGSLFFSASSHGLSICAVVPSQALEPVLIELHKSLFNLRKKVGLVVFGKGNIGARWIELFAEQKRNLEKRAQIDLVLAGVFGSQGGVLNFEGLDASTVLQEFEPVKFIWEELLDVLSGHPYQELILLDITASESLSRYYPEFAQLGAHLISANKYAGSAETEFYRRVRQSFADHNCHWLYNATVGAGLPVQTSIEMLNRVGDQVTGVKGVFSGTLSWLLQNYDGQVPFSELVEQAWQQGLTEPDPRLDLSGKDVQRKLLILAREAGYDLELSDIELTGLIPPALQDISLDEFWQRLPELDEIMADHLREARRRSRVLLFQASFNQDGEAEVGLVSVDENHSFAHLRPSYNVFAIKSNFYRTNPLVIQGPGAGQDVTAAAVQADLDQLCQLIS